MTRRVASKMMPPIWNKNPIRTNLISPKEAMTMPRTMKRTLKNFFGSNLSTPNMTLAVRTATGVVA